jgi:hypothetical protein
MSVCPCVRPSVRVEQLVSHWTDFDKVWYLGFFFSKMCQENSSFIKIRQKQRVLYMKMSPHLWQYLAKFFLEWEMFQTKVVEKIKIHISCSVTFFGKSHRLWDNGKKYGGDRGYTNDVTIWRIRGACWISKAICTYAHTHDHTFGYPHARTHTHTDQYVILIAFPSQECFRDSASVLRYSYNVCLVLLTMFPNPLWVQSSLVLWTRILYVWQGLSSHIVQKPQNPDTVFVFTVKAWNQEEVFLFFKASKPVMGPMPPLIRCVPRGLFPEG